MEETIRFCNALIAGPKAITQGELFVRGGKIIEPQQMECRVLDLQGKLIAPGFIDLQVNGGFGYDFSSEPESIEKVAQKLPSTGVTSFLATLVSLPLSEYEHALTKIHRSQVHHGAALLGTHLEGPYCNAAFKGAHSANTLQQAGELDFWQKLLSCYPVKIVTLAPEVPGALKLLSYLQQQSIIAACGHTNASYDELRQAKQNGLSMATHLFNAMRPLHHRECGPIGFVLGDKAVPYSLIADGKHISDAVIRLAWNAFPEGLILTSDASAALGLKSGSFSLAGQEIEIREGAAYLSGSNILAGGMCPLNEMVVLFKNITGCSLHEALQCVTSKPAKLLGLEGKKGSLAVGADADFVILDPETLKVHASYVAGIQR